MQTRLAALVRRSGRGGRMLLNFGKRMLSSVRPYSPMQGGRRELDAQYAAGQWDYLRSTLELPRFGVVVAYCHEFAKGGAILEIGCGEGLLEERLSAQRYSRFVGVDVSSEAIQRARARASATAEFVAADAMAYVPDGTFDAIVFNEVLEYFDDPARALAHYAPYLRPQGVFIVSMFSGIDTNRSHRIWRMLAKPCRTIAQARISTQREFTWNVRVLAPRPHPSATGGA